MEGVGTEFILNDFQYRNDSGERVEEKIGYRQASRSKENGEEAAPVGC